MSVLVIAEKPSVGRTIAHAISNHPDSQSGYIDCGVLDGEHVLVSWAQGHLINLADPKAYGDRWERWSLDTLPIDPGDDWKWTINEEKGAGKRYRALKPLIDRADVLVNACDPDREGEGIFTRIVNHVHANGKRLLRLWANSMDADGIRSAWENMKPEGGYAGLAQASDARAKADWMQGMTASRVYSLLYNTHASVGRVESPTLKMIVDRDAQITDHVSTPFWTVSIPMGGWELSSEKITSKSDAQAALQNVGSTVHIETVTRRTVHTKAPTLYDLTTLQRDANSLHSLTAGETLSILQGLYEKGLATYPRTDSRYITTDDVAGLNKLLDSSFLQQSLFVSKVDRTRAHASQVADNKKVEGHTALLPTLKLNQQTWNGLTEREQTVMRLIVARMWQATGEPRVHQTTKVETTIADVRYTASSDKTIDPGWTQYKPQGEESRNSIPDSVVSGVSLPVSGASTLKEGHTQPPAAFTDASLLSAMEHASKQLDDKSLKTALEDDSTHAAGLGTPATRAGIIDKIVKNRYAQRKGKRIQSTKQGQLLCRMLAPSLVSVETTARMEQGLTDIANGRLSEQDWLATIHQQTASMLCDAQKHFDSSLKQESASASQESFGACPVCGKPVVKTRTGFYKCSANKSQKNSQGKWEHVPGSCTYGIWKKTVGNNHKKLTDSLVRKTLAGQRPRVKSVFHSAKTGKDYDMILVPDAKWGIETQFPPRK